MTRFQRFFVLAAVVLLIPPCKSQTFDPAWLKTVVLILSDSTASAHPLGTGFFVKDSLLTRNELVLVTCSHLIENKKYLCFRMNVWSEADNALKSDTFLIPLFHPKTGDALWRADSLADVAIVPLLDFRRRFLADVPAFSATVIGKSSDLKVGDAVAFLGFPFGITDVLKNTPLLRYGRVALLSADFLSHGQVVLEAYSLGGNSGSPVFLSPSLYKDGVLAVFSPRLIGIMTAHFNNPAAVRDTSGKVIGIADYHSGLSQMSAIDTIIELLNER